MTTADLLNATAGKKHNVQPALKRSMRALQEVTRPSKRSKVPRQSDDNVPPQLDRQRLAKKSTPTKPSPVRRSLRSRRDIWAPGQDEDDDQDNEEQTARTWPSKPIKQTRSLARKHKDQLASASHANAPPFVADTILGVDCSPIHNTRKKAKVVEKKRSLDKNRSKQPGTTKNKGRSEERPRGRSTKANDARTEVSNGTAGTDNTTTAVEQSRITSRETTANDDNESLYDEPSEASENHQTVDSADVTQDGQKNDDKKKALEKFEEESELYECQDYWATMLHAASFCFGRKQSVCTDVAGDLIKLIGDAKDKITSLPEVRKQGEQADINDLEKEINTRTLEILHQCSNLNSQKFSGASKDILKDIYTHTIPRLIFLLKAMVQAWCCDGALDSASLGHIIKMMDCALGLCHRAYRWPKPRPALDAGVLRNTKNAIVVNLRMIMKKYISEKQVLDAPGAVEKYHEKLRLERQRFEQQLLKEKEILERRKADHRRRQAERNMQVIQHEAEAKAKHSRNSPTSLADRYHTPRYALTELDNAADFNTARPEMSESPHARHHHRPQHMLSHKPSTQPAGTQWTDAQTACLLMGLEKFRGPSRFEDIAIEYGNGNEHLADKDVDEIMTYSQRVRADFEAELNAGGLNREWPEDMEWLKSVPA